MVSKSPLFLVIFTYFLYFLSFSEAQTNVTTTTKIPTTTTMLTNSTSAICDTNEQFRCKENICIPIEWMCDYVNDCKNGEVGKLNLFFVVPEVERYQAGERVGVEEGSIRAVHM